MNCTCENIDRAIRYRHYNCIEQYLEEGVDPNNATLLNHYPPIHYACYIGGIKTIEILLKHGANINLKIGDDGVTPIHLVCNIAGCNGKEFLLFLLGKGANPFIKNSNDTTAYDLADKYGKSIIDEYFTTEDIKEPEF